MLTMSAGEESDLADSVARHPDTYSPPGFHLAAEVVHALLWHRLARMQDQRVLQQHSTSSQQALHLANIARKTTVQVT